MQNRMAEARFSLPDTIRFEPQEDYAKYCNGSPVNDVPAASVEYLLQIEVREDAVLFTAVGHCVSFELEAVCKFVADCAEPISHMTGCTLRIIMEKSDGKLFSLPILSSSTSHVGDFFKVVSEIEEFGIAGRKLEYLNCCQQ